MPRTSPSAHAATVKAALVIDDHPLYCDALATMMETVLNLRRIRKANSLSDAMQHLRSRFMPDLVMLDLNLPNVSGLSGFMKIKEKAPDVPVIVISAYASEDVVQSVMAAGAAGFIPKDVDRETLRVALLEVCEGKTYFPPGYQAALKTKPADPSIAEISRKIADLSHQQSRILSLICKGKPNKLIAYEMQLAEATVKAHITALLRRLRVQSRTQAALMVREVTIRHELR